MIRRLMLTTAVLALAACGAPGPAPAPAPETAPVPVPAPAATVLTAQGFGPLRIGMTRAEVETALGADSNPGAVGGPDPASCDTFHPARAPTGMRVMVEQGVLTSIWLDGGATIKTDRGFGVGDAATAIKAAYGPLAYVSPHKYAAAPAEYITTWSVGGAAGYVQNPAARGIAYHIGTDGRAEHVAAGGPSIQYVEGCL
jgi:predicted small lipoprotein YifL